MYLLIGIVVSLVVFIIINLIIKKLYIYLSIRIDKKLKLFIYIAISFLSLAIPLIAFFGVTNKLLQAVNDSFEMYLMVFYMSIISTAWCYCNYDLDDKLKLKFGIYEKIIALKRIIVYTAIMVFLFFYGYHNMSKVVLNIKIDVVEAFINATLVPSIISFDRILNQVKILIKPKSEND